MPVAELNLPGRLLAGGGPGSPDPRVVRALATPLIGQFDPAFTAIMDEVMQLARATFLTRNQRCFPVSALAAGGLEAVLNTLLEPGDPITIEGGPGFAAETAEIARRCGASVMPLDHLGTGPVPKLVVAPLVDPASGRRLDVRALAEASHAAGTRLLVEATPGLAAFELRVDDWAIDACVAGVDHAVGAPSGMALVTFTPELESLMQARTSTPKTSYLDLLQLQAYWSPERLNHHTAPTSLVYGLREALRLLQQQGLDRVWARHQRVGRALRAGLQTLQLEVGGDPPYALVTLPLGCDEAAARQKLLEVFGIHVRRAAARTWRIGLLGAAAQIESVMRVLAGVQEVLDRPASGAATAALAAYEAA